MCNHTNFLLAFLQSRLSQSVFAQHLIQPNPRAALRVLVIHSFQKLRDRLLLRHFAFFFRVAFFVLFRFFSFLFSFLFIVQNFIRRSTQINNTNILHKRAILFYFNNYCSSIYILRITSHLLLCLSSACMSCSESVCGNVMSSISKTRWRREYTILSGSLIIIHRDAVSVLFARISHTHTHSCSRYTHDILQTANGKHVTGLIK